MSRRRSQSVIIVILAAAIVVPMLASLLSRSDEPPVGGQSFVAKFNSTIEAIPASDRAWLNYVEAAELIRPFPEELGSAMNEPGCRPEDAGWPRLAEYLRTHAAGVSKLREAAAIPHLGCMLTDKDDPAYQRALAATATEPEPIDLTPPSADPWPIDIVLPQLGELGWAVRILRADARLAASKSDGERFALDCVAIFRVAMHTSESPFLICQLRSFSERRLAMDLLREQLTHNSALLTDKQLRRLRNEIESVPAESWNLDLAAERASMDDIHNRVFAPSTRPSREGLAELERRLDQTGSLGSGGQVIGNSLSFDRSTVASRPEADQQLDRWFAAAEDDAAKHLWERSGASCDQFLVRVLGTSRDRYPTLRLLSSLGSALNTRDLARMERDAVIAAIALEQHRRAHGTFPASWTEIDPALLAAAPVDEFTGKPLLYHSDSSGIRLYSVGPDRDDDGGRPVSDASRTLRLWSRPPPDGDLVFLAPGEKAD